jgi:hypothetical protein
MDFRDAASVAIVLSLLAQGCSEGKLQSKGCKVDEDCGSAESFLCDTKSGECRCRANGACANGEVCNREGYCQAKVGCYVSRDCPDSHFCDAATNTCLPQGRCASDLHCKFGEVCDKATNLCKPGCRTHGDCSLHEACVCKTKGADGAETEGPCGCDAKTAAEREKCAVGKCSNQSCGDTTFCGYGEVCRALPEGGLPQCIADYDPQQRPYCDNCVYTPGQNTCGKGANFCLIDTYSRNSYCGADCSQGQQCPNGYACHDVVVVFSRWECYSTADCGTPERRSNVACKEDKDCPNNAVCGKPPGETQGFCQGKCGFHEGASRGFCSCVVDDDCFQDECDTTTRTCSVSKRTCELNGAGCRKIRCVDFGGAGGCHIGQNCAPVEGVTCGDLRKK